MDEEDSGPREKNCIFCRIAAGEGKLLYKDDILSCLLDINPRAKGHTLVLPNAHYPMLPLLPWPIFRHMCRLLPSVAAAVKRAMVVPGADIIIANGAAAGQESPHFLVHIIPREPKDARDIVITGEAPKLENPVLAELAAYIEQGLGIPNTGRGIYSNDRVLLREKESAPAPGTLEITHPAPDFAELSMDDSLMLLNCARLSSQAVFQAANAHATNIIVHCLQECVRVTVLPRFADDGLSVFPGRLEKPPNAAEVHARIKDEMFYVPHMLEENQGPRDEVDRAIERVINGRDK